MLGGDDGSQSWAHVDRLQFMATAAPSQQVSEIQWFHMMLLGTLCCCSVQTTLPHRKLPADAPIQKRWWGTDSWQARRRRHFSFFFLWFFYRQHTWKKENNNKNRYWKQTHQNQTGFQARNGPPRELWCWVWFETNEKVIPFEWITICQLTPLAQHLCLEESSLPTPIWQGACSLDGW